MTGLALTGIYMASIGLVVLAVEQGYVPESEAGILYIAWAAAGLAMAIFGIIRKS